MRFEQPVAPVESALEAYLRNVVEPAAAIATESIQAAIPGAQEIERKARQYRREGASQVEAVTRAYRESDLPPGVKGAIELGADPLNLIPGLGVVSVKTIPLAARAAAAGGRFAAKEMTVAAAQAAERAVPYAQKLRVGEAGFARIPGKPPARAVEVIIRDLRALGTQEGLDRATMNQVVKAVRNQDLLAIEELPPLPRSMQELVDRYAIAVQEGSAREARRIGKKIPSRPFSAIRTTKDDAIRAAREISPDEPLYVYQSPAGGFVATNDFDPALLDILKPDVLPPVKVARKARAKPAPVAEAPVEAIEVGDFIGSKMVKGDLREPLGFVEGEGVLGRNIPAWKVRLANGKITAIPKDDARFISRPLPETPTPTLEAEVARGQADMLPGQVPEAAAPGAAKEPWQMTQKEYAVGEASKRELARSPFKIDYTGKDKPEAYLPWFRRRHQDFVEQALSEGKPVPPEVLADYPGLVAQAVPSAPVTVPPEAVAPKVAEAIPPGAEGVPPTGGVPPTAEGGIAPSEPVLPRPRTLADMNREAKGMRAMTPEQRAAVMDVAKPIEGDILYQARPFDEHAQNLLGPDTNFMKALRGVPGVKQVFGAWHPAAMARDNPVAMIGLRQSIFQEIEKSRIRFATLRWWHDADAAFGFKRTRTAFGLKPASGVWKATKVKPASASVQRGKMFGTINDIIEHSERYAPFTDEQVKVLALAENTLTQSVRDAQRAGVNVVELAEAYWPRAVIRGPKGEKGFAGIRRRISGAKGYTHQRVFADIDDLVKPGFEVETDPRRVLASRLEAGVDTIAQANARKQIAALPGVEKPLERMARKFPEVLESARKARATRDEAKVAVVKAWAKVTPEQVMAMRQAEADYISSMREVFAKKIEAGTPGYYELRLPSGRIAPQELVEEVGRFIDLPELRQPGRGAAALTQEVSQLLRTTLTNVDLAAGFIQGQALFYRNNVAWWKSQGHTVVSLVDDPTAWVAKNFDIIDEGVRMGAIVAPTEFLFAKQGIASIPLRVPYAGPALGSFNRAFEWFITTGQTELYKAARLGVAKNAGMDELVSLGSAIRKQVGTESYAILGIRTNQRTMEALSLFAARFFRANVGILGQSFTRGPGGAEARRAIGGLIAGGTALLIGINWALHKKLPEMTDPYAPSWMQFRLGNTYFSTFGPFYPYFRTIARMSMALIEGDPVKAATEAKRFLSSKESLPLRAIDIAGQLVYYGTANVYGTKIEKDWASIAKGILGEFVTPISIQEVPSAIVEGRPEQAFEIGGLVGRPVRLASEWQKDLEPYFDIPPEAEARFKKLKTREEYREKNPEVDAKLFIIGQVDSLKTIRAKFRAVALMRENGIGLKDIRSLEEKRYESKDHAALRRFFEAQFPQPQKKKGIWAPWKKQRIWAPGEYRPGGLPPPIPTRTPW